MYGEGFTFVIKLPAGVRKMAAMKAIPRQIAGRIFLILIEKLSVGSDFVLVKSTIIKGIMLEKMISLPSPNKGRSIQDINAPHAEPAILEK